MAGAERNDEAPRPATLDLAAQAVVVQVAGVEFGIEVGLVREVLHVPPITRLPFPPPSVLGVVSVRGSVVPVVDLGDRLFSRSSDPETGRLVIVTDPGTGGELALLVDAVADLIALGSAVGSPPPEIAASLPAGWIGGVFAPRDDRLVTLLEIGQVIARTDEPHEESR